MSVIDQIRHAMRGYTYGTFAGDVVAALAIFALLCAGLFAGLIWE